MKYMGEVGFSLDNFIDLYCGTTGGGIPGRWQIEMEIGMNSWEQGGREETAKINFGIVFVCPDLD